MRVSVNWLKDYIDLDGIDPALIAATLTDLGLEVEEVHAPKTLPATVVVGRILEAVKHPQADALQLCKVSIGGGEPLKIVCGAANARKDLTVAVATIGTEMAKDFVIKETKIRGELSQGMLCSEKELGISDEHDGILELPADMPLGETLAKVWPLDTTFVIKLTPNRSDCLGMIGIARDLAAKLERPWTQRAEALLDRDGFATRMQIKGMLDGTLKTEDHFKIHLESPDDCPRFTGLFIKGVKAVPSPMWMRRRLQAVGMRPINLIVDVTNYAMLEAGHPIHAYDERDVREHEIRVRRAKAGEELKTLDGVSRKLLDTDLVIADGKGPVGLAGVMGGESSEVKDDTTNIFVEVAQFHPSLVRKTAKRLALHTEASHRFERGVDVEQTTAVAYRVGQLIWEAHKELGLPAPKIAGNALDVYPKKFVPGKIALRLDRARQITGLPLLSAEICRTHLEAIGIMLLDRADERMLFQVPSWRADIEREIDLIEEVARLYGYEKILSRLPLMEIAAIPEDPFVDFLENVKTTMALTGLTETVTFPFVPQKDLDQLRIGGNHPLRRNVTLANPLAEDTGVMTPTLALNLVRTVKTNHARGAKGIRVFEVARTFHHPDVEKTLSAMPYWARLACSSRHVSTRAQKDSRPIERYVLGALLDQPFTEKSWQEPLVTADFFRGKAVAASLIKAFNVQDVTWEMIPADALPWLNPRRSAVAKAGGRVLGYVGELHPEVAVAFELEATRPPILLEWDLEALFDAKAAKRRYDTQARRYPPVARDLAFVVNKGVTHAAVLEAVNGFKAKKNLTSCHLFDVYEGKNIPEGKKSMAYSVLFQSPERTLTDKEVEQEINSLLAWLKQSLAAELR